MNANSKTTTTVPILAANIAGNPGWLDEAVDPVEAGSIVGRSAKALGILRVRGGGPPYVKCGRSVRYIRRDLFEWLQAHRVKSTSESAASLPSTIRDFSRDKR